jgi:hypothetical protein
MNTDGSGQVAAARNCVGATSPDWGSAPQQPVIPGVTIPCVFQQPPPKTTPKAALKVTLGGPRRQRFGRFARIKLWARCATACDASAAASVRIGKASKLYRTWRVKKTLPADKREKIELYFRKRAAFAIRRALARHKRLVARVKVVTRNSGGQAATAKRKIKLVR